MSETELDSEMNSLSLKYSQECLQEAKDLFKWQKNENILDVGCGDGKVTTDVVLPFVPENFAQIIGIDVSNEMINYAKKHSNHPKINYLNLDITAKIPEELKGHFQHIFSFFCVMLIENQRDLFENLHQMLAPGGQIMLSIVLKSPILDAILDVFQNTKWACYMENFHKGIYPYNWIIKPEEMLQNFLISQGFNIQYFKMETKNYEFSSTTFDKFALLIFPYIEKIPKSEVEAFNIDFQKLLRAQDLVKFDKESVTVQFVSVNVLVTKT